MTRCILVAAALLFAACTPRRIPGTEIDDTSETRAILGLMEQYRAAVEARDPLTISKLVSPEFKDDGGNSNPDDDLDARNLVIRLKEQFELVTNIRLELDVRKIRFHDDGGASAVYHYNQTYEIPSMTRQRKTDAEIKEMWFTRVDGQWKILTGI